MVTHPHKFTLNLLKNLIDSSPATFQRQRKNEMLEIYEQLLGDLTISNEDIESNIVLFGEEIWPYREAYEELYDEYGRDKEEKMLESSLPDYLKDKYKKFISEKGNIERIRGQAVSLDIYFTSLEQDELVKAELTVHDKIHGELGKLIVGEKQSEYFASLEKWKKKQEEIKEALKKLKAFAERSAKWRAEILDKVKVFEQGFGYLERPVTLMDVMGEIEYYEGVLGIGEE